MLRNVRRGFRRCRLAVRTEMGHLYRRHVLASKWRIGERLSAAQQRRSHGRAALPLLSAGGTRLGSDGKRFDWSQETIRAGPAAEGQGGAHEAISQPHAVCARLLPRELGAGVRRHDKACRFYGGICRRGIYNNMKNGGRSDLRQ